MRHAGIALILLLISSFSQATQYKRYLKWAIQTESYSELITRLDSLEFGGSTTGSTTIRLTDMDREIVDGYYECIRKVSESIANDESPYLVRLIRHNDEICFIDLSRDNGGRTSAEEIDTPLVIQTKTYERRMARFRSSFVAVYGKPIDFEDLFRKDIVYGASCGFAGSDPEYRVALNTLVKERDLYALKQWLSSAHAELQLYAIEGILILKQRGMEVDERTLNLIDEVGKKEGNAYTCSGCFYSPERISKIVRELKKKYRN